MYALHLFFIFFVVWLLTLPVPQPWHGAGCARYRLRSHPVLEPGRCQSYTRAGHEPVCDSLPSRRSRVDGCKEQVWHVTFRRLDERLDEVKSVSLMQTKIAKMYILVRYRERMYPKHV